MGKAMKAMVAAAGLPALDDAEAWGRIGAWWRDHGEPEADLTERINDLEDAEGEMQEQLEKSRAEAKAVREYADLMKNSLDQCKRELMRSGEDNATLRKVIDKFTMTVPAVVVGQSLRLIESYCEQVVPDTRGSISTGRISPDEQKWHPVLRAILNEARRALTAMEAGK
jgi:hypothetical protein